MADVLIVFNPYDIDYQGDFTAYNPHADDVLKVYKSTSPSGPWTLHGSGVHTPSNTADVNFNFSLHQGYPGFRDIIVKNFPQNYYIKFALDSGAHPSSYEFTADLNIANFRVDDAEEKDFETINALYFIGYGCADPCATNFGTDDDCVYTTYNDGDLVINEIHYNPATSDSTNEFIEVYNGSGGDLDVSCINLTFQGSGDEFKRNGDSWEDGLPPGTIIPANGYLVFANFATTYNGVNGLATGTNLFEWQPQTGTGNTISLNNTSPMTIRLRDAIPICLESYILGDCDGDGVVTLDDSTMVANCSMGIGDCPPLQYEDSIEFKRCDTDGNGYINAFDGTNIMRWLNGIDDGYHIGEEICHEFSQTGNLIDGVRYHPGSDDYHTDADYTENSCSDQWPKDLLLNGLDNSIELIDPSLDNNCGSNWQRSLQMGGTPGYLNTYDHSDDVIFSEIQYNVLSTGAGWGHSDFEFVELYNRTEAAIDISGWGLEIGQFPEGWTTADFDFIFPEGTFIPALQNVVVARNATTYTDECVEGPGPLDQNCATDRGIDISYLTLGDNLFQWSDDSSLVEPDTNFWPASAKVRLYDNYLEGDGTPFNKISEVYYADASFVELVNLQLEYYHSLELLNLLADDWSDGSNWQISAVPGGSPGYLGVATIFGCIDTEACNYNADAHLTDGSCSFYWDESVSCDCDGNPLSGYCDCNGETLDACGICGSGYDTGSTNCAPSCLDNCDVCNGDNVDDLGCGCFNPAALDYWWDDDGDGLGCGDSISYCLQDLPPGWVTNSDDTECNCETNDTDECGQCGGGGLVDGCCPEGTPLFEGLPDCNGECGGDAYEDMCGTCDNDPTNDCVQDCAGVWGGDSLVDDCNDCSSPSDFNGGQDDCGVCYGGNADMDCAGDCGGSTIVDCTGVCGGTAVVQNYYVDDDGDGLGEEFAETVCDDIGIANGWVTNSDDEYPDCYENILDECGVCAGDNSSCSDCAGVPNGDSWVSDCGCVAVDNSGNECDDCAGVPYGNSVDTWCNDVCAESGPNYTDCGTICGDTYCVDNSSCLPVDDCNVCQGSCFEGMINCDCTDCYGTPNGIAFIDDCGSCVGGSTGLEENYLYDASCATLDNPSSPNHNEEVCCGFLATGMCDAPLPFPRCFDADDDTFGDVTTQRLQCEGSDHWIVDCTDGHPYCNPDVIWGGEEGDALDTFFGVDDCGFCYKNTDGSENDSFNHFGNTSQDCLGECPGGNYIELNQGIDDCGICHGGNIQCTGCMVEIAMNTNEPCWTAYGMDCTIPCENDACCIWPIDCNGVELGGAYIDQCQICVGGDTGLETQLDCNLDCIYTYTAIGINNQVCTGEVSWQ